ncbi:MAG: hypothetical protein RL637_1013, partial [Pseudomonadota bacterium]
MLDPYLLRTQLAVVQQQLAKRKFVFDADNYAELEAKRKAIQIKTQQLQNERNSRSKAIGQAKAKGEDIKPLLASIEHLADEHRQAETELADILAQMNAILETIPNVLDDSVPEGNSEADNIEISRWGIPPQFDFTAKDHIDLGNQNGEMNFELGAKIASARFVVLTGKLARLQRAIIQFMLDTHINEHGYIETYTPFLANAASLRGTG